jgi:PKD repeat protein
MPWEALPGGRFRLDEEYEPPGGGLEPGPIEPCLNSPVGLANNGEVEDYPVEIGVPDIRVDPTEICLTLPPDTIWNGTLRIYNDGDTDLDYDISEQAVTTSSSTELPPGVEPVSAVLELPPDFEYSAVEPQGPVPSFGWVDIMTDDFESFPGSWSFYTGGTDAYWGQETYRAHSPTHSAYCAASGTAWVAAPGPYPNDMDSWMVAGPFSLEDAIAAEFNFSLWFDTQPDLDDFIAWMVSTDGSSFTGYRFSAGDSGGTWWDVTQDLANDPWLANYCGEDEVWIAFWFYSNSDTTAEGAYVDDVVLHKDIGCDWLNVLPKTGSVPPAGYDELTVTVDTTGLSPSFSCLSCSGGESEGTLEFMSQEEVAVSPGEVNAEGVTTITQASYTWQSSSFSPSAPSILVYADDFGTSAGNTYVEQALQALGLSYTGYYADYSGFGAALTTGGPWDLVLVSHNNWFTLGNWWTEIEDYVNAGGQVIIETFDIDGSDSEPTTLWATLGVSWASDMSTMQSLYRWQPTHPIFTLIESVPDMTSISHAYIDDGDKCDPVSPTIAVAGFTGSETAGQGGIFSGSIVNSFIVSEFRGDDDTDGTLDAVELWMNEISYVATYASCGDICCDIVINSNDPDEDPVVVPVCVSIAIDFGDAPDPSYPSLRASDGARHIPGNIWLGTAPTAEIDSLQVDLDANDDGVTFLGSSPVSGGPYTLPYVPGQYGAVQVVVGGASIYSCLHGWIDWDQDGDWENSPDLENIFCSYLATGPGTYVIEFTVPGDAKAGPTWSRFRIDEPEMVGDGELEPGVMAYRCLNSPFGLALNGEVEDYPVGVEYIPPEGWSSDDIGAEVNAYCEFEDVYTTGSSFPHDTNVDIYIVSDYTWGDGMSIPTDVSSDGYNTVMTDSDGNLGPVVIWPAPVDPGEYDIVFDANQNGVYDALIDYVDHPNHPGFIIQECPVASFTASPLSGSAPLTVQFTDLSTGDIDSWLWYFGDGESGRAQNPSHTYYYAGTYPVTLTVEGPCGTDTATGEIEVIEEVAPPRIIVRNLQIEPANALPGQQVVVTADVVNQGGSRGSKNIELVINGQAEQAVRVGVDPGTAKHITFTTSKSVPGTYEVFIEGQASAFNVFLRPRVTTSQGVAGGLGTAAIIAIVVIAVIFLVGMVIVFIRIRR